MKMGEKKGKHQKIDKARMTKNQTEMERKKSKNREKVDNI